MSYQIPANNTSCATCPAGYYCIGGTFTPSSSNQGINSCSCGYYSSSGSSSCTGCGPGKWSNSSASSCSNISAGYYGSGACSSTPNKCAAGKYSSAGSSSCSNCSCGSYSVAGSSSCTNCGAGKWAPTGSGNCASILAGYYGSSACSATPNACATGKYSSAGSSTCSNCTNAPSNAHYTSNGTTSTNCNWACDSGYTKNAAGSCIVKPTNPTTCSEANVTIYVSTSRSDKKGGCVLGCCAGSSSISSTSNTCTKSVCYGTGYEYSYTYEKGTTTLGGSAVGLKTFEAGSAASGGEGHFYLKGGGTVSLSIS